MKYKVEIRKNETKEIRVHVYEVPDEYDETQHFNWSENNNSCDCNRELLFERAVGREIDNEECSEGRFSVKVTREDGEVILNEL